MIIKCCRLCPFFMQTSLSLFVHSSGGVCKYCKDDDSIAVIDMDEPEGAEREAMRERAARRLRVLDANVIPVACPLRDRDIVVTLGVN